MEYLRSMDDIKISFKSIIGFLLLIICLLALAMLGSDVWQILSVGMFGIMILICLKDISRNCFFFFFLLSFFIFLMSGDIAELLFNEHYYLQFSEAATLHAHKSIFICLLAMFVGFIIFPVRRKEKEAVTNNTNDFIINIRHASKILYVISLIFALISTLDTIRFVASHGYVAYYISYNSILPSVLVKIGEYTPLALCVYLSTFPSKKESSFVIKSFLLYSLLTLLIGSRSGVIFNSIFLLCYFVYRNYTDRGKTVWISKKTIVFLLLSVPFLLSFLYLYEYIRTGREVESMTFGESIVKFFVNIGSASQNIKYGYELRNEIPKFRFYSLGGTLNYFKYGTLFNLFDLQSIPSRHTVQFALESHSFDAMLSYLTIPKQFLQGNGTGSSFIAELFADFGYVGVAAGSLVYGCLFKRVQVLTNRNWLATTIKLFIFFTMLSAPRASYDGFIAEILNVNHILYVFLIYLLASNNRKKYKREKVSM